MITNSDSTSKPRRTRAPKSGADDQTTAPAPASAAPPASKLDQLTTLLTEPAGATLDALTAATGWQVHSVRGAMAGALKKRGLVITSDKIDGVRTYRASIPA